MKDWSLLFPSPPHEVSYLVDGLPRRAEELSVRCMNFGQPWRNPGTVEVPYVIVLPVPYAVALIEHDWNDLVSDSQQFPAPEDPLDRALRALDWPEPRRALADPVAAPLVLDFYKHELLMRWLGDVAPASPGFVLNTIDEVRMAGSSVSFVGRARPHDPGVAYAYQDV